MFVRYPKVQSFIIPLVTLHQPSNIRYHSPVPVSSYLNPNKFIPQALRDYSPTALICLSFAKTHFILCSYPCDTFRTFRALTFHVHNNHYRLQNNKYAIVLQ